MTSAIGMTAGMGLEIMALVTTLIALAVMGVIPHLFNQEDSDAAKQTRKERE